jgi:cytochrome P450
MVHRAPNTLTIRGGKDHMRRRRIMSQGVSEKAQREYEPRIMTHINKICDVFLSEGPDVSEKDERRWSPPMDMAQYCKRMIGLPK